MLTKTPKQGDQVLIVQKYGTGDRRIGFYPIEKVGRQYLTIMFYGRPVKFGFDGQNGDYELFETGEAFSKLLQRERNILQIKQAVSTYRFGNGLSDETLEQISQLIEGKQSWSWWNFLENLLSNSRPRNV